MRMPLLQELQRITFAGCGAWQPHAQARRSQPPGQNIITFGNLGMEKQAAGTALLLALALAKLHLCSLCAYPLALGV